MNLSGITFKKDFMLPNGQVIEAGTELTWMGETFIDAKTITSFNRDFVLTNQEFFVGNEEWETPKTYQRIDGRKFKIGQEVKFLRKKRGKEYEIIAKLTGFCSPFVNVEDDKGIKMSALMKDIR